MTNQMVHIHDPESVSNLSITIRGIEENEDNDEADPADVHVEGLTGESEVEIYHEDRHKTHNEEIVEKELKEEEDKRKRDSTLSDAIARVHDLADVVLASVYNNPHQDSNHIWMLECKNQIAGGPIFWKTEQVRLRHVNTGVYLTLQFDDVDFEQDDTGTLFDEGLADGEPVEGEPADDGIDDGLLQNQSQATEAHFGRMIFTTETPSDSGDSTLFKLTEAHSLTNTLSNSKATQFIHNGIWIRKTEHEKINDAFQLTGTKRKEGASNMLITRLTKEWQSGKVLMSEPFDVVVGLSIRDYLKKFLDITVMNDDDSSSSVWPDCDRQDQALFSHVIKRATIFIQGYPVSIDTIGLEARGDQTARLRRQHMFREQGTLQILISMINTLIPISEATDITVKKKKKILTDESKSLIQMGEAILAQCFSLVYQAIKDNPSNQMYVADFMPVLLAHLGGQPQAAKCVTEMLNSNMELQETKIGVREITIFVDKLRRSQMNSMYLSLLRACCSCMGSGVDNNQGKIAEMLFADMNDVIITIHADWTKLRMHKWNTDGSLYIFPAPLPGGTVRGEKLLYRGHPQLALTWTTSSIQFSPLGLFGKLSVPIEELYGIAVEGAENDAEEDWLTNDRKKKNSQKKDAKQSGNNAEAMKQQVARYLIDQFYLSAEMCLDRNYIAMNMITGYFTYEILVTIMKLDLDQKLKSAAVNLLIYLHIDRDPQVELVIPCLTRTWTDIENNVVPQLPTVDAPRKNDFGLLQELINVHVKSMQGTFWTEYSYHVIHLLHKLVKFNFYGSAERLKDVVDPLLSALDRRSVIVVDEATASTEKNLQEEEEEGGGVGEDKVEEDLGPWQTRCLSFLESIRCLMYILSLVFIAIAVTIYQVVNEVDDSPGTPLYVVNVIITAIFVGEITLRMYCYRFVRGDIHSFFFQIFNIVDLVVIAIDIGFLSVSIPNDALSFAPTMAPTPYGMYKNYHGRTPPPSIYSSAKEQKSNAQNLTKTMRLVRLVRLVRVFRALRIMNHIQEFASSYFAPYKVPGRFAKSKPHEVQAMVKIADVLSFTQRIIEDRCLSLFLRAFYSWETKEDTRTPSEIFESVVTESSTLSLARADLNDIFIDVLMFNEPELVQVSLDVLVSHYSTRATLLRNARKIQLLVSTKRQRQFKQLSQMLLQLESNAETQELWGNLVTDADKLQSKQTSDILTELLFTCRAKRAVLEFNESFKPEVDIQDLLRNLGFFEISMKVYNLMESIEEDDDGNIGIVGENTLNIVKICSELMYWWVLENPENQLIAFNSLDFFVKTLDDDIGSHNVIKSIFKNNEDLMRSCPPGLIKQMSDKICKDGRKPAYLSLLSSITFIKSINIYENQFEVLKEITGPSKISSIKRFLCPVTDPEYQEKVRMMEPFTNSGDVLIDQLPDELAYHFCLLDTLSGCTVGKKNVTSFEAKVQSCYNYYDVLQALLDPRNPIIAKVKMGMYYYNVICEVEMRVSGLQQSGSNWRLLRTFPDVFRVAAEEILFVDEEGWNHPRVSRQKFEYVIVAAMIIGSFFNNYYPTGMRIDETLPDAIDMTSAQIEELIAELYNSLKELYYHDSSRFSSSQKFLMWRALDALNKKRVDEEQIEELLELHVVEPVNRLPSASTSPTKPNVQTQEVIIHTSYEQFLKSISNDENLMRVVNTENLGFIRSLQNLPFLATPANSDVRYEPFIEKLVTHVRSRVTTFNREKRLDASSTKSTVWILMGFRTMIEDAMGMTIFERDIRGGDEEDEKAHDVVTAFNNCGVTRLCLDLLSGGIDFNVQIEAIKLCVGLLLKEGGARAVQDDINAYLKSTSSHFLFLQLRKLLNKMIDWHKYSDIVLVAADQTPKLPEEAIAIRFIQLLCEGHNLKNQDVMREQPFNIVQVNLLDDFVTYLNSLSRLQCRTSTEAAIRIASTVLEVLQGPCNGNQRHFALNTELIEALNRLLRAKAVRDCLVIEELNLKFIAIKIFLALIEGRTKDSLDDQKVYERLLSVIHLDVIEMMAYPESVMSSVDNPSLEEVNVRLSVCSLVFLEALLDFDPSLAIHLDSSKSHEDVQGANITSIEMVWNNKLQRRFFNIPEICFDLAKSSKDQLVEEIGRDNLESTLNDFLLRARELYREIKHQEQLGKWGLSGVFSKTNQDIMFKFVYFVSFILNMVVLAFYAYDENLVLGVPQDIQPVVLGLAIAQVTLSALSLILYLVVRAPVMYGSLREDGHETLTAVVLTLMDFKTIYTLLYLGVSILGCVLHYAWLPVLLLDIIDKSSTARDVLMAVAQPFVPLMMTLMIIVCVCYIYAFMIFTQFSSVINYYPNTSTNSYFGVQASASACQNMWDCFVLTFDYGLRLSGGIGDMLNMTVLERWWLDFSFFLVVLILLLNVVLGIIIDTFSSLRSSKLKKEKDTIGKCFTCGIEKDTFERKAGGPDGYKHHISKEHNMWDYLYFIIYLWEQDKDDDDGLELFVRKCIYPNPNDVAWFPMNSAMCLQTDESGEDAVQKELHDMVDSLGTKFEQQVGFLENEVAVGFDRVAITLANMKNPATSSILNESMLISRGLSTREGDSRDDSSIISLLPRAKTAESAEGPQVDS